MVDRVGLIAGNGRFPILCAESARKKGIEVLAIGIKEETHPELEKFVDKIYWMSVGELTKLTEILKAEKIRSIIMAGQVRQRLLFDNSIAPDQKMQTILDSLKDKKTDSIIGALARGLEINGIKVLSSVIFLSDYMAGKGLLTTARKPDKRITEDIIFGRKIAKGIARFDIGQTVVVKDKVVLAVESIEGTDETIIRAAKYGKDGIVVVKVSKPFQDMRFDVPVIGPETIKLLEKVKGACISVEARKTLIIDKSEVIRLADEAGIIIVGS